jgi:hypothetical protein
MFQRKHKGIKRLAGFFAFIWSNLCTRHISGELAPRGHHDWPDKRATRGLAAWSFCLVGNEWRYIPLAPAARRDVVLPTPFY